MRSVNVLTMLLAGGVGERLFPLTTNRCKPTVPFGGNFRIIDFTLMNCVLSGMRRIHILSQYHSHSIHRHTMERWNFLSREMGEFIDMVPPKLREASTHYRGTADAIYRNIDLLEAYRPDVVLILSGDHVYRADYERLVDTHVQRDADITVLTGETDPSEASSFGVVNIGEDGRIVQFVEKPANPLPYAVNGRNLINLGVYCFETKFLVQQLVADAKQKTAHDFGKNILPGALDRGRVLACPLEVISPDGNPYWRDVGTIDSYFETSMDLVRTPASFELKDPRWSSDSRLKEWAPARLSARACIQGEWVVGRNLIASGVETDDAHVVNSILSPEVRVGQDAELEECVVFPGVTIGPGAKIRHAIIEEGVEVPAGLRIGFGGDESRFLMSAGGVTVISKGAVFGGEIVVETEREEETKAPVEETHAAGIPAKGKAGRRTATQRTGGKAIEV
jgi:glucose-1-phosphate adenylyltransferase